MSLPGMSVLLARLRHGQGVGAVFARGAVGAFLGKAMGLAAGFGLQVLLARVLGADGYGTYIYALTWVTILLYVSVLGFDTALIRFVAQYLGTEQWGLAHGILRRAAQVALFSGLVFSVGILLAVAWIQPGISAEQTRTFLYAAMLVPVFSLSNLRQAALRAMKRVMLAELPDGLARPLIIAALIVAWWSVAGRVPLPSDAMLIQVLASLAALILGGYWLTRALPREVRLTRPVYETRTWFALALPMVLVASTHMLLKQTDIALLGLYLGTTDAGIYAAMVRLSDVVVFGLMAANAIAAPMIAEFHHAGRRTELQRIVTLAARGAFAFTLAASLFLTLCSGWVINLFGNDFLSGRTALYILLAGQLVNALTGPVGYLLALTGHQNRMAMIQGIAALINLALNLVLIPRYGMAGAAMATATALILWNVWMLIIVRGNLGIRSTIV